MFAMPTNHGLVKGTLVSLLRYVRPLATDPGTCPTDAGAG